MSSHHSFLGKSLPDTFTLCSQVDMCSHSGKNIDREILGFKNQLVPKEIAKRRHLVLPFVLPQQVPELICARGLAFSKTCTVDNDDDRAGNDDDGHYSGGDNDDAATSQQ